jgi:hypothetical protein
MGLDPQGTSWYTQAEKFPTDISILYSKAYIGKADGTPTTFGDGVYNHHIVLADANKPPLKLVKCPNAKAGPSMPLSIFASSGQEGGDSNYTTSDPTIKTGYYLPKNDRVFSQPKS